MAKLAQKEETTKQVEKKQVNLLYIAKVLITNNREIRAVAKVAKMNKEGFTVSLKGKSITGNYWSVAFEETQNGFGFWGLAKAYAFAKKNKAVLGGWYNSDNDKYYFDACTLIADTKEAVEFGKANKQLAIFNLATFETLTLN